MFHRVGTIMVALVLLTSCEKQPPPAPFHTPAPKPAAVIPVVPAAPPRQSITVYVTDTGKKYHRASCSYLRKSSNPMDLEDAKARGLTPCSRCNP